jgi:pre-rRNA-processing protein IPI1
MGKPKKKTRNPGVGVDFKRVKHKVGKKLPKARNETDTDFKSRSINLPNQVVKEDRSNIAVNYQNLTLKVIHPDACHIYVDSRRQVGGAIKLWNYALQELLNQTSHHNDKSRKHALNGLSDLFGRHPEQLHMHAAQVSRPCLPSQSVPQSHPT